MENNKGRKVKLQQGFKKLYEAEGSFNFFKLSFCQIPLWLYARDKALNIISGISSYGAQLYSSQKINIFNLIGRIFYFIFNFYKIFNNDIVVFTNERHLEKHLKTGEYYNPFAELTLNENKGSKKALIFEFPIPMTRKYKKISYKRYLPLDFFLCLKQILSPLSLFYYSRVKKEFSLKFRKVKLWPEKKDKEILLYASYGVFNIRFYSVVLSIIKFLNPKAKAIYSCMGGFDKFPGIIEIQPASITGFNPVYIYPQVQEIKDFLKNRKMVVFSKETKELLFQNGYPKENIQVTFNPKVRFYFLKNLNKDFLKAAFKNKIVIVGNWGGSLQKIYRDLVLDIEKNKDKLEDWDISLILHPTEENSYKNLNLKKVKVFENYQASLWQMFSEALCTINVVSSSLEESTYFGCFNVIIEDKSFEDQKKLIELLCGNYPYKVIVPPEKLVNWFKDNESMIKNHFSRKREILKKNYEYFKNI